MNESPVRTHDTLLQSLKECLDEEIGTLGGDSGVVT